MRSLESCYGTGTTRSAFPGWSSRAWSSSRKWPASGHGEDPLSRLTDGRWNIGTIGLIGFFVMSGFLITQSAQRLSVPRYLWHRVLRIFPAFLVCLQFTAFLLAPALWLYEYHGISGFFSHPAGPVDYVTKNARLGIQQWGVSGLPMNTPENKTAGTPIFDAPLWTLQYEFLLYAVVAALAVVGLKRRAAWMLPPLLLGTWLYTEVISHNGRTVNDSFYGPMPILGRWINLVYVGGLALIRHRGDDRGTRQAGTGERHAGARVRSDVRRVGRARRAPAPQLRDARLPRPVGRGAAPAPQAGLRDAPGLLVRHLDLRLPLPAGADGDRRSQLRGAPRGAVRADGAARDAQLALHREAGVEPEEHQGRAPRRCRSRGRAHGQHVARRAETALRCAP